MPDNIIRHMAIRLSAFRAYLEPKTFDFTKKQNLAIFAPNGSGKSSVVDSVEFLLSKDGTIERLGIRATANRAGTTALAHDLAQKKNISSEVGIVLLDGNTKHEGKRLTTGERAQPDAAVLLKGRIAVDPVIRGHALRRFVEEQTPEDRYGEVGRWLQLTPLVEVQKNLRALRAQIKQAVDELAPKQAIDARAKKATSNALQTWSVEPAVAYANIYDPFLGSGTTLIAAETTGGVCVGMELDPRYVDVAIRRWQAFTGCSASLLASGRSFAQVEADRNGAA